MSLQYYWKLGMAEESEQKQVLAMCPTDCTEDLLDNGVFMKKDGDTVLGFISIEGEILHDVLNARIITSASESEEIYSEIYQFMVEDVKEANIT